MGRLAKLKREHIKEVNKTLDEGRPIVPPKEEEVELQSSPNVKGKNINFLNKMKNL